MDIEKKNICINSRIKYTYNESWYKFFATFCFDLSLCDNETGPRFHVAENKNILPYMLRLLVILLKLKGTPRVSPRHVIRRMI